MTEKMHLHILGNIMTYFILNMAKHMHDKYKI